MNGSIAGRERLHHAAWLIAIASAFVLALAALLAPTDTAAPEARERVLVGIPGPLVAAVVLAVAIAETILLGLVLSGGRRRRKKGDDEFDFELYHEQPKMSPLAAAVLLVLMALVVAGIVYAVWHGGPLIERWFAGGTAPESRVIGAPPISPERRPEPPAMSVPFLTWSVSLLAAAVGAGALGLALWIVLGQRLAPRMRRTETAAALAEAVDESLEDLRLEPDARVAIVKCYRRFEQAMARARLPRRPWETPVEYMHAALGRLALPRHAVERLTALFQVARFSRHPVGPAERDIACAGLADIKSELERRQADASAS